MKDYYDILGVLPTASNEEIKKAYRLLSKILHPDMHNTRDEEVRKKTEIKFKELKEAYEILANEDDRKKYDRDLKIGKSDGPRTQAPPPQTPNMDSLLKRAFMCLEEGNWYQANGYFDRVLEINPENGKAYLGKLCAELKVAKEELLANHNKPLDYMTNYQRALSFVNIRHRAILEGYNEEIIERIRKKNEEDERAKVLALKRRRIRNIVIFFEVLTVISLCFWADNIFAGMVVSIALHVLPLFIIYLSSLDKATKMNKFLRIIALIFTNFWSLYLGGLCVFPLFVPGQSLLTNNSIPIQATIIFGILHMLSNLTASIIAFSVPQK